MGRGADSSPGPLWGAFSGSVWRGVAALLFLAAVWHILLAQPGRGALRGGRGGRGRRGPEQSRYAYITVVCSEDTVRAAMVLVHSIKSTKTPYDVVVLTRGLSAFTRQVFASLGARVDPQPDATVVLDVEPVGVGGGGGVSDEQPVIYLNVSQVDSCFLQKLSMWRMVQYEKVLALDPLMLVLENIDDVFEREELSAAPDNDLPDRFNPSLMLLQPLRRTFVGLLHEYGRLQAQGALTPPESVDLLFFNHFFITWPREGPAHHLDYGYNAVSRLGYSATWNEWVHPKLRTVQFRGAFERWNDVIDKHYPPTRRYDHLRWEVLRDMNMFLSQQGVDIPGEQASNEDLCQTDYMHFAQGAPVPRKLSVLLRFHGQLAQLQASLLHLAPMRFIHKVYVLPMTPAAAKLAEAPGGWNSSKPLELLSGGDFTASALFRPIESLATDCLLICDDSVQVAGAVLHSAFKYWLEHPHRLVGFFPHAHYRNELTGELVYVEQARQEYSMVGLELLLMHADYLQSYTCSFPAAAKEYVDRNPGCEDVAFNLLAAQLSSTIPLLMMDSEKRVLEIGDVFEEGPFGLTTTVVSSSSSSLISRVQLRSACLNDLEAVLGGPIALLGNTTEAKLHLQDHDVFTKAEFRDPNAEAKQVNQLQPLPVQQFDPIFDFAGHGVSDENFRFMSSIPRVSATPEVVVMPSAKQPRRILCIMGNSSSNLCHQGGNCSNSFALLTHHTVPREAAMLLGTSLILHSRYGFDDRFHTPNIVANLFYPYPDYGFLQPARAFFFRRGSLETRLSPWSRLLFRALLGDSIAPFRVRNGERPLCLEKAVMTRRYRPVAAERNIVLREAQQRAWAFCTSQPGGAKWLNKSDSSVLRVFLLHGDESAGYGVIGNLDRLLLALRRKCRPSTACELTVLGEQNFTNFCQQVLQMGAAHAFITVAGDGTMNHVIFMLQRRKVLELVPYGLEKYDPRVLKVYVEAARWAGLEHTSLMERDGPQCPQGSGDSACRFFYRRRPMQVDVGEVLAWLDTAQQQLLPTMVTKQDGEKT